MAIPPQDLARITRWCDARVPESLWDTVKVEADTATIHVTIVEVRPKWSDGAERIRQPVARLRWNRQGFWSLYWPDRNGDFHEYEQADPTPRVQRLLDVIDRDETNIFWGLPLTPDSPRSESPRTERCPAGCGRHDVELVLVDGSCRLNPSTGSGIGVPEVSRERPRVSRQPAGVSRQRLGRPEA